MTPITRILCAVDFSEFSHRALEYAAALARLYNASVSALHVYDMQPAIALAPYLTPEVLPPVSLTVDRTSLMAQLQELIAGERDAGLAIGALVTDSPSVREEIVAQAGLMRADLLVLGTHGRSGFQRFLLGSVAERVLRAAACPVLTVPRPQAAAPVTAPPFTRILCAVDFSDASIEALGYAASLAADTGAALTVLHVMHFFPEAYEPFVDMSLGTAHYRQEYERRVRERLQLLVPDTQRAAGLVETVVSEGKPYREILREAGERRADLIVIGFHGRNPVDRLMFGSTTQHVVRQAPCPVLTLRAR